MTRKKVKLAFITNDSARKATYKKRKRGLLKKMDELTTLCDVKACAVLYSPYESKPVVWPGASGARDVISSFKRLPEMEKVKKMVSQEEFLRQRVAKAHEQLKKQQKENREKEMIQVMYQCLSGKSIQNMNLLDLSDLGWVINQQLNEINKKIDGLRKENYDNSNSNPNSTDNDNKSNNNDANNNGLLVNKGVVISEGLQGQKGDYEAMQMQMMMQQPWSSFMDMMSAPLMNEQHHNNHHHVSNEIDMNNNMMGENSNNNNNNMNNMNMMLMMGQMGDYHGHPHAQAHAHGVNPSIWSNHFYP